MPLELKMAARPEGYSLSRSGKVVTELSTRVKWENIGDADAPLWVQLDDADAAASVEMREESIKSKDKQWMQWQRQEVRVTSRAWVRVGVRLRLRVRVRAAG